MTVVHKKEGKFETVYIKNVPVVYASVQQPKKKYESEDREYTLTAFVSDEDRRILEDEVMLNKQLYKVGVDKNKKRQIKFTTEKFGEYEGLSGVTLTCPEFTKDKKKRVVSVVETVQKDGKKIGIPFKENLGNGSVCTIKLSGYRNQDELLVVSLSMIVVEKHVPYSSEGTYTDDELGIEYQVGGADDDTPAKKETDTDVFDDSDFE